MTEENLVTIVSAVCSTAIVLGLFGFLGWIFYLMARD